MVAEFNELLADRTFWEASSRTTASGKFTPIVVDIFYHDMLPEPTDAFDIREAAVPLPRSTDSDYRQVLLLGTTGGGKTTLVRQLIGTDPHTERFPSTSTAKTTVADTEIVLSPGPFRAVVTFLPRDQVRDYVEECMSAAVLAAYRDESDDELLRRLLNHVNQRFRLSYILGTVPELSDDEEILETSDDALDFDLTGSRALLNSSAQRLRSIAEQQAASLREELQVTQEDERVIEELFEESFDNRLRDDEHFLALADEFMDEIERRFELLTAGTIEKNKQGWPRSWSYESEDRQDFLKIVSRFSSNYAPYFGTLLTPLVNGIRIAGPFAPSWSDQQPALVLFDVEGLGHSPDSAASLPTAITRRIEKVDAVLLVDNATQPMQAAPAAAMRNLASSGQAGKLIICFTHFDGVVGDNLPTFKSKEQHVLASAEHVLAAIGEQLGPFAERTLRQRLHSDSLFLGGLQETLTLDTKSGKRTVEQLEDLLEAIESIGEKPDTVASRPIYDRMNLVLSVQQAAEDFHAVWDARLGLLSKSGFLKEHWTRIKALARRFAEGWDDEYMNLKPIADMHKGLQENIYRFIQNPVGWTEAVPTDDEKQQVFAAFAQTVSVCLMVTVVERLKDEAIQQWRQAYYQAGQGSTFLRAKLIAAGIYDKVVPAPDGAPFPDRNKFLHAVIDVVRQSAEEHRIVLR